MPQVAEVLCKAFLAMVCAFHAFQAAAYDRINRLHDDCNLAAYDENVLNDDHRRRLSLCRDFVGVRLAKAGYRQIENDLPATVHPDCAPFFRRALSLLERSGGDNDALRELYEKEHGPVRIALPPEPERSALGCPGARLFNPELRLAAQARPYWNGSREMPTCTDYKHLLPNLLVALARTIKAQKKSTHPRTTTEIASYVDAFLTADIARRFPNCTRR